MHKQFNPHSQNLRCQPVGARVEKINLIVATKDEMCGICMNPLGTEAVRIRLIACNHEFHTYCLQNWYLGQGKTTCPYDRIEFDQTDKDYMREQLDSLLRADLVAGGGGNERVNELEQMLIDCSDQNDILDEDLEETQTLLEEQYTKNRELHNEIMELFSRNGYLFNHHHELRKDLMNLYKETDSAQERSLLDKIINKLDSWSLNDKNTDEKLRDPTPQWYKDKVDQDCDEGGGCAISEKHS